MHEFSIVQSLLDLCEDNAKENSATKVTKVTIKIGTLSGVEPELLKSAFDTFKDNGVCKEAILEMNIQPVVIECKSCGEKSTLKKIEILCPKCKSDNITLIDGEEMFLMSLEME